MGLNKCPWCLSYNVEDRYIYYYCHECNNHLFSDEVIKILTPLEMNQGLGVW